MYWFLVDLALLGGLYACLSFPLQNKFQVYVYQIALVICMLKISHLLLTAVSRMYVSTRSQSLLLTGLLYESTNHLVSDIILSLEAEKISLYVTQYGSLINSSTQQ